MGEKLFNVLLCSFLLACKRRLDSDDDLRCSGEIREFSDFSYCSLACSFALSHTPATSCTWKFSIAQQQSRNSARQSGWGADDERETTRPSETEEGGKSMYRKRKKKREEKEEKMWKTRNDFGFCSTEKCRHWRVHGTLSSSSSTVVAARREFFYFIFTVPPLLPLMYDRGSDPHNKHTEERRVEKVEK